MAKPPKFLRVPYPVTIAQAEKIIIESAMDQHGGDVIKVAAQIGMGVGTVYNRLRDYRLLREFEARAAAKQQASAQAES